MDTKEHQGSGVVRIGGAFNFKQTLDGYAVLFLFFVSFVPTW